MRKRLFAAAAAVCVMTAAVTASAEIGVTINGTSVAFDVPPQLINDRTMVPMRAIFEALGAYVEWDEESRSVYGSKDDTEVALIIGSPYIMVNGNIIKLDAAPVIVDDRTLVPVRAISEAFGLSVEWDGDSQTVIITGGGDTDSGTGQSSALDLEHRVLDIVNQYRSEAGLNTLVWDDDLAQVALSHSEDMVARGFFDHTNPDGLSPFDRMDNYGISYLAAAENIAMGQTTAEAVMSAWMNSSGHHDNIMNESYNKMGVGVAYNASGTPYWTQCFTD